MMHWPKDLFLRQSPLLLAVLVFACEKSAAPVRTESPPSEPVLAATSETAHPIPRRATPIIITNVQATGTVAQSQTVTNTNTAPVVTCSAPATFPCMPADGEQVTLTAHVEDADGNALSVVWNADGKDRFTQQVPAGGPPTSAEVTFAYTLTPGDHVIKVTALDGSLSGTCEMTVTIQKDSEPPIIACPPDINVAPDPGQCSAVVTFAPRATDNCPDVTVTSEPPSGSAFPIGMTPVTCTATDTAGNIAQCSFNVIVQVVNRCPRNESYWRQNPGVWPINSLRLGNATYNKSQLVPLLRATVPADASMVLARQLIVASLNMANGSDPRPICAELNQAQAALGAFSSKLPYRVNSASAVGRSMTALANTLIGYNGGMLTPNCVP